MTFSLGIVGAGQFSGQFARLFLAHPGVGDVHITDLLPERAEHLAATMGLTGTFPSYEAMLESKAIDAVAIFTQRWTHGPLVVQGLNAGKHVYSAVPMAISTEEIAAIIDRVKATGLTYMMGETSHYHPATVHARRQAAQGAFGRLFYAEGDYVHDMDLGFYEAYQYSGGENWKATASYPPLLYPTHAVGGVLGAWRTHAVSVSAIGVRDERGDGVFDKEISRFDNDFSNATALFEVAGGGSFRTNEFRRVGYPSPVRESRFRFFGTEASMEQLATVALWQDKTGVRDISELLEPKATLAPDEPSLAHVAPTLRAAFTSGSAPVHDRARLPREFDTLPNGHEGSHHFLVDDFVTAVTTRTLPSVNAWVAARYTLPGVIAHASALKGGVRLEIPDFGDAPA
ncbi:Gfo/Idh/MocA family oxidoreductase [Streptomyces sp. RY43-2]|uniref:Gfo/Idh/MocA family oxidoreductase n=1 Tax=Streptomyces macrolidinus TaxID=2952607 RepID=A0ABT0ZAI5_9ACTN|nr:Gfo/Idh/MocA family oxidoreductase [Streptomyces macrolidinus]MCN9240510.1 Gfo/Idh/MocA family oxidoreductase [Streptomyces macrolidinus]